jgi:hypothetical protein
METSTLAHGSQGESEGSTDLRAPWQVPVLETIEAQRLVAVLASCQESAPSAVSDPFCSNDCA